MEKGRRVRVLSLCALLVAVLGLTVAFATLSQTLKINGNSTFDTASWDIHFEKTKDKETETTGDATFTEPTLNGTSIENFRASLTKPGDSVTYYFDIVNNGTVDAVVSSYIFPFAFNECQINVNSYSYCMNFDFNDDNLVTDSDYMTYLSMFNHGILNVDTNKALSKNDIIKKGETKHMKLYFEYLSSATILPEKDLTLTSKKPITITFNQDEN